ncbi:MAG TPA: UvrD-helicase domain-containing protein [Thermoanaerobaculia bacterium]|nr:UvrD-helicase domain-containing protein [Thermoanaerobaculia bacterium]
MSVEDRPGDRALAADREARQIAQREFGRPLLVEAGAGTGKTTTLTARLLAWSLGPGWERAEARVREREAERRPLAAPSSRRLEPDPEAVAAETLSRVVAITFTEAAAAEMAKRAGETLSRLAHAGAGGGRSLPDWLDAGALPAEAERARRALALLGALDHLVVRTIHAFCRSLLATHPLEAGLHPELEVDADGSRVEEIARETVEGRLAEGYGEPGDPDLLALAAAGIGPADLVAAATTLVQAGVRAEDLTASPFSDDALWGLRAGLTRATEALREALGGRLEGATRSAKGLEVLATLPDTIRLSAEAGAGLAGFAALCADLARAWEEARGRLRDWSRGKLNKSEEAALGEAAGSVTAAAAGLLARIDHLRGLDPELLEHGRRALAPVLAEVRRSMRRRGVVTFQDLLAEARDLLVARPDVAARARRRIDQLLVDELQDTDRLQCDVVAALGLDGAPDERPGLFLVGDPKQSIYGWRNADLRAYEDLWRRVEAAGGLRLTLYQNFRSVPAILAEVAETIGPVMLERPGLQPRFEPLVACPRLAAEPGFTRGRRAAVEHWVSWRAGDGPAAEHPADGGPALAATRSGAATLLEAEAIARDLVELHREEGVPWSAAAVLLRAFTDLDCYLDAFRRHGVPFAVTGDRQYYRRREVIDAAALVRAVLDPGDHLALLTLLRSPAVGVPDAALVPLWSEELPRRITELDPSDPEALSSALAGVREAVGRAAARLPHPSEVPGLARVRGWEGILVATVESLAALRRAFSTEPADRFVEELRRRIPLEAIAAARYLGSYRLANLERFFRRLTEAMEASAGDVEAILRALRRGVAQALEEEEGLLQGAEVDAVAVTTIHKAKGLDFAHVYVAQMHKSSPPDALPSTGVGWGVDATESERRLEYCLFGAPTPGFAAVAEEARRVAAAERVRTLYVAMTRAEERLVLLGRWPEAPAARPPEDAGSFIELLGSRFESVTSIAEIWQEAAGSGGRVDRHRVRWVFPALEEVGYGHGATGAAPAKRPASPDPAAVAAVARRLRELRALAASRSARPVSAPASEEAHRRLEELAEDRFEEGAGGESGRPAEGAERERGLAMAAGAAVHRVLEELDLAGIGEGGRSTGLGAELARQRERLPELLRPLVAEGEIAAAVERSIELLDRLLARDFIERLATLGGRVVARELPVLLPPGSPAEGPVGFVSGSVDLLYRDAETGGLVVADYKTDRVETAEEIGERSRAYAPQARLYARAVQEALGLDQPPRAELWFLWRGEVVTVPARPR